uniref:Uncharacterized protein n=1 Tax=Rhizophora mucronata TaxID=61149 RepID=A0A2P2PN92_RHIMU
MQPRVQLSGFSIGPGGSVCSGSGSATATSNSVGVSSSATTTSQMLRDFSLEIYDKKELQFLGHSVTQQASCSKS